ncbi:apolipoprotein O, a isoform X2 [Colossoma macropomum]|uniref:apolipoprotein O, a isoform X2 n=1 Tax=Colossoma macropomum TaxID=42526 RepID=UPI001864CE39|nr:apolipoprotein O, a isoform X2 [Colossoma macropomum]
MYKVGGVAGLSGALGLWSASVLAAESEKPSEGISIDELSLYTTPPQNLHYVEPEKGQVEEGVATLRKLAEPYTSWGQGVYGAVKPKVDSAVQFGQDSYTYLKNPPSEFYPRAGVIGFAGILGLFLARGSRLKKLVYPTGLMAVGASLYYPQQAATIAKSSGDALYDWALQAYVAAEKLTKGKPAPAPKTEKAEEKPSSGETTA